MKYLLVSTGGLLCGLLGFSLLLTIFSPKPGMTQPYPEIQALQQQNTNSWGHDEYEDFLVAIAKEKGAIYAFEVMKQAPLPFGMDTHLLGHAVGDVLYEQKGVAGMADCTHDFRNACSHTIVIGALLEFGESAAGLIQDACHEAPGGTGAYTMCFHGLGHGVLAFNEYDMEKTTNLCRIMGTDAYNHQEADQCLGGAVMEIIGGGGHDRDIWEQKRTEYLQSDDPLSLCESAYLNAGERTYCYIYITPYLLESVGADMSQPDPADFEAVFALCNEMPAHEPKYRNLCFHGLGKEFIALVGGRDYRNGITISPEGYSTMHQWCDLAKDPDGISACKHSIVSSLYWGGENALEVPSAFCAASTDNDTKMNCYRELIDNIQTYIPDIAYRENACNILDQQARPYCEEQLLTQSSS